MEEQRALDEDYIEHLEISQQNKVRRGAYSSLSTNEPARYWTTAKSNDFDIEPGAAQTVVVIPEGNSNRT